MLNSIKAIVFDLDGTIYFGEKIIDGAINTVNFLYQKGIRVLYISNNSTKTRMGIYNKLIGMGLKLSVDDVYASAYATALYVKESKIKNVYCIGSMGLITEINSMGINVTDNEWDAEAIVIGLDLDINYKKISKALNALRNGSKFIVCNRDKNFPLEENKLLPGCGSIVAAVEEAYDKKVDFVVGKPNTYMMEILTKDKSLKADEVLVVGDSYTSDIEMAKRFNCPSIWISNASNPLNHDKSGTLIVSKIEEIVSFLS